jgi:hypothetical protein
MAGFYFRLPCVSTGGCGLFYLQIEPKETRDNEVHPVADKMDAWIVVLRPRAGGVFESLSRDSL